MFDVPLLTDWLGDNTYKVVWTVLWALLSLVTVSLLTFARAKPLSKCVFLSLFAHIRRDGSHEATKSGCSPACP